jgi:glycosyltransferase involved in cell wall biosynthesis
MRVSVIIPVYNASAFIRKAVSSALNQPETTEIILVEDGSTDDSLQICEILTQYDERIKLVRHPDGMNCGAAASRNLGMRLANSEFIAFLDADDFYLPGRFSFAQELFANYADCDGVYEAVGIEFQNKESEILWASSPMASVRVTTMTERLMPSDLFQALLQGKYGHFHMDGLTIKRNLLEKSGLMNEKLRSMNEDTDFILRLSLTGHLYPGNLIDPVAIRLVHESNRISAPRTKNQIYQDRLKMHMETYRYCKQKKLKKARELLINRMAGDCRSSNENKNKSSIHNLLYWAFGYPEILLEVTYWKELVFSLLSLFHTQRKIKNAS